METINTVLTVVSVMVLIDVTSLFIILKNQRLRNLLRNLVNNFLNENKPVQNSYTSECDCTDFDEDFCNECTNCTEDDCCNDEYEVSDKEITNDRITMLESDYQMTVYTLNEKITKLTERLDGLQFENYFDGREVLDQINERFDKLEKEVEFLYNND
jgi:hypothetical protein